MTLAPRLISRVCRHERRSKKVTDNISPYIEMCRRESTFGVSTGWASLRRDLHGMQHTAAKLASLLH